jgi:hypothetical protein
MDLTSSIKHAPRWAWYTAAGVGVGAAALKLYKNRASDPATQVPGDGTPAGTYTTPILTASPTSVITPPVVGVSTGNDGGSLLDMMQLWTGAVTTTIDQLTGIYGPVAQTEQDLLAHLPDLLTQNQWTPADIQHIIQAAPGPAAAPQAPPVVYVNVPAAQPPVQAPTPVRNYTHTVDNGKHGAERRVWCNCGDHKVADGACWAENSPCT